jgi:hypothetical protein
VTKPNKYEKRQDANQKRVKKSVRADSRNNPSSN